MTLAVIVHADHRERLEGRFENRVGECPAVEVPEKNFQVGARRDVGHVASVRKRMYAPAVAPSRPADGDCERRSDELPASA
ncbi:MULTISPECIES: hypothetical protein [unclassified Rhodococcus (in: high G+C Gram-positive bacteria)]|uniref:hypothetical protein n=1 Tax=unclassified Rhodococcus (in: high G+C Gram-positive bacteria) TaxID=192944 RepID=UPI0028A2990D|nr:MULTISPECIES: hypothetical protein [unclassified Rhodococcus (in: high G+C Gram-positive bacteria)]